MSDEIEPLLQDTLFLEGAQDLVGLRHGLEDAVAQIALSYRRKDLREGRLYRLTWTLEEDDT